MTKETDLDELSILKHGYERFLSNPSDLDDCDNAIITVRRQQQITTHFGPLTTKNKIKVSLSQEQILNPTRNTRPNITRSQSINIQKSLISPFLTGEFNLNRRISLRPSLIPVKIKEQSKLRALTLGPNQSQNDTESRSYRSIRKCSDPFERRNYVSQQESTLSSLPVPMTQSLDPTINLNKKPNTSSVLLDKFKCGICLNVLSDSRVLDCLHTFCLECLYSIENTSQTKISKVNVKSSNCSEQSKENDKKEAKSLLASSTKPIKKVFSSTVKKRFDEPKKPLSMQMKRPLSSITEKSRISLKCPICGVRTEIAIGGVSRVPKNYLLERQLQNAIEARQTQSSANQLCSQCYGEIEAIAYCVTCDSILCDLCQEAHLRQRWTAKHSVMALPESKVNRSDREIDEPIQNATMKCFIHPTQDLKLYCVKCDQVACHNCTILLHKGHQFETIEQAKQHIMKSFQMSVEKNQKFHDRVNYSISKLAGSIAKINANADAIRNEIESFLKDYFDALKAHKEALFWQINKAKEVKSLSILEQQEYLKKRGQELKQANTFAENLLRNGNDIEILTFIGILQNRFEFCQKSKMPIDPKISNTFQFLRDIRAPITSQQHNIPIYGVLATKEIETE